MATVTVKNIPDELYDRLKRCAVRNRRSINSQIIFCLDRSLTARRIDVREILDRARRLRGEIGGEIRLDWIDEARRAGRP